MERTDNNLLEIDDLIAKRWSPRCFDAEKMVEKDTLDRLFEAARWAPSAFNAQPWHFVCATKGSEAYNAMLACVLGDNATWAKDAPVLVMSVAKNYWDLNGMANPWALHDVGLAMANLSFQATAMNLFLCEIGSLDEAKCRTEFNITEKYQPISIAALGYVGSYEHLPQKIKDKIEEPRTRKPLHQVVSYNAPMPNPVPLPQDKQAVYEKTAGALKFGSLVEFFKALS